MHPSLDIDNLPKKLLDSQVDLSLYYVYFVVAALVAGYLVWRCRPRYRAEIFLVAFYLLTGNANAFLTVKIPGFSFFELQPERILLFLFGFLWVRRNFFSRSAPTGQKWWVLPWFQVFLVAYIGLVSLSQIWHIHKIGAPEAIVNITDALNFLLLLWGLQTICTEAAALRVLGRAVLVGAVVTSLLSLVQFGIDPFFMRMGDLRPAFGDVLRANGLFSTEYYNAYFLIAAIIWALVTLRRRWLKWALVGLFSAGVLVTFQRMSWVVLSITLLTWVLFIERPDWEKMVLGGLSLAGAGLAVGLFFYQDIANSALVQERMAEGIDSRFGYYDLALKGMGQKPVFGFGDRHNETYYYGMLNITRNRHRAEGGGSFHNGFFEAAFENGLPAALSFVVFGLLAVGYFGRLTGQHLFFAIPFLFALLYAVANLTNAFPFSKYLSVVYAMHLGIGLAARHRPELLKIVT